MIYLKLLLSFLKIGLFSFGGGYAAVPLIQSDIVNINHWLTMDEYVNLVTIAGMTPGSIAVNSASFVGLRIAGISGALIATFGCIFPSLIILMALSFLYMKYGNLETIKVVLNGLRPAIVSLIASAATTIFILALFNSSKEDVKLQNFRLLEFLLFFICLFLLRKLKWNPILIILGSGVIGAVICYI